jgi:outer membrane protein
MKKVAVLLMGVWLSASLAAQEMPWMLRGRLVQPQLTYTPNPGEFSMDKKLMPEVDLSYFFSDNLALEFSFTALRTQRVYRDSLPVGTFENLPPTLLAQYHVTRWSALKPYVGAGIAYTKTSTLHFDSPNFPVAVDPRSWGMAWQLGMDVPLDRTWSLNVDWKRARFNSLIATPLYAADSRVTLRTVSMGLGYRF